jgi:hypothetical protein
MSLIKLALEKHAGLLDTALSVGSKLMAIPTVRNAAIGAGTGALAGAVTAKPGETLSGALKGGAIGGLAGGVGTLGKNVIQGANKMGVAQKAIATAAKSSAPLPSYGTNLMASLRQQGTKLGKQIQNAVN